MGLLLIPLFFLSLICTVYGLCRSRVKVNLVLIVFSGLPVLAMAFPLVIVVIDSMLSGLIESRMSLLWSVAQSMTIDDGNIYMGAVGLVLVVISSILLAVQFSLVRFSRASAE